MRSCVDYNFEFAMGLQPDHGGLTEEVRNIGRKVRARRDEEIKKRREIQRVEPSATDGVVGTTTAVPVLELPKPKDNTRKKALPRKRGRSLTHEVKDKNVDRWMPITDHLPEPETHSARSSVVQLHGLPIGVTAVQIRKFFSGLRIQRLIVLPKHNFTIRELDAQSPVRKAGLCLLRHEASSLRLFVKFESVPTAAMAVQRSGEIMQHTDTEGASVRVTMLPKSYATILLHTLAIDCPMNCAHAIDLFLQTLNHDLDETVPAILWTEAMQRLQLTTTRPLLSSISYPILPRRKLSFQLSDEQITILRRRRDELHNVVSELQNKLPFPFAEVVDPTIIDPALALNVTCAKLLHDEIDRVDRHVLIADRWQPLNHHKQDEATYFT